MKRRLSPMALAALFACALLILTIGLHWLRAGRSAVGPKDSLNLFIWTEYIDPDIIKKFEQKYHVKVHVSSYESDDDMLAKLQQGGTAQYDLVVPSTVVGDVMIRLGLLHPLDHRQLPNLVNIDERFRRLAVDPGNHYLIPYQWGTLGIAYRKDAIPHPEQTWGLIFDRSKQPGPFVLLDVPHEMIGAALKYDGKSMNTSDIGDLRAALARLRDAKSRSVGFDEAVGIDRRLLAKQVSLAVTYAGNVVKDSTEDPQIHYFIPREGSEIFLDTIAIPKNAPHPELAHRFINFLLEPQIGAQLSNFNRYATPNRAAMPYILPADKNNIAIYPPASMASRLEFLTDVGSAEAYYDAVWTRLKSQ